MDHRKASELLKNNLATVENKFKAFFASNPSGRPGETLDRLSNHHTNLQNLSIKYVSFDDLGIAGLPPEIVSELKLAFEDFRKGVVYT